MTRTIGSLWSSLYQRTSHLVNATLEAAAAEASAAEEAGWGGKSSSRGSSDLLQLDLSGDFDLAVFGPAVINPQEGNFVVTQRAQLESSLPLVRAPPIGSELGSRLVPLVKVGCKYDIAQTWFAITKVFLKLQWKPPLVAARRPPSSKGNSGWAATMPSQLSTAAKLASATSNGLEVDFLAERSLLFPEQAPQGQLRINWRNLEEEEEEATPLLHSTFTLGAKRMLSSISFFVPLLADKRRFMWQCTLLNEDNASRRKRLRKLYTDLDAGGTPWWLPTMTVNAAGNLDVLSQATFRHPLGTYLAKENVVLVDDPLDGSSNGDGVGSSHTGGLTAAGPNPSQAIYNRFRDHRIGFKISARRQLDWGVLGLGGSGMASDTNLDSPARTLLRVQVQDMGREAILGLLMETQLEQPLTSMRFVMQSEFASDRIFR